MTIKYQLNTGFKAHRKFRKILCCRSL